MPVPPWVLAEQTIESVSAAEILSFARSLDYREDAWVGDRQHILYRVVDELRVGPLVKAEPVSNLHLADSMMTMRGQFVARFHSEAAIPELGLARGWTYLYIDRQPDGHWRSLLFPETVQYDQAPLRDLASPWVVAECGLALSMHEEEDPRVTHAYFELLPNSSFLGPIYGWHVNCPWPKYCCNPVTGTCSTRLWQR